MKAIVFIQGTHCTGCKALIEDVCSEIKGIKSCKVDYQTGKTEIDYDKDLNWNFFKKEIEELGEYKIQLPH